MNLMKDRDRKRRARANAKIRLEAIVKATGKQAVQDMKERMTKVQAAHTSGCTARDAKLYHCDGCDQKIGHTRFDKNDLYNKAKTGRTANTLVCGYVANSCSTMTKLKLLLFLSISVMGRNDERGGETLSFPSVEHSEWWRAIQDGNTYRRVGVAGRT